jgi:fructosamine-3-kinase
VARQPARLAALSLPPWRWVTLVPVPVRFDLPAELTEGLAVQSLRPVYGGLIAQVYRAETSSGPVCIKTMRELSQGLFAREAEGLRALAATATVPVPEVLRDRPSGLVLQWVEPAAPGASSSTEAAEGFGRALAAMHAHHGSRFGSIDDSAQGHLGVLLLDLRPTDTWADSFLHARVVPLAQRAVEEERITPDVLPRIEALTRRAHEVCGPAEPPATVHGDLWHGNVLLADDGRRWLVDPSVQYGHRELDLAFMRLFGGFEERVFDAYQEVAPLADGWRERIALHQLLPLLANALMFGHSCQASVFARLSRLGV